MQMKIKLELATPIIPIKLFTCTCCYSTTNSTNFPKITAKCTHKKTICNLCVERHCEAEINSKGDLSVKCPIDRLPLEFNDIQRLAAKKDFDRFDMLLLRKELQRMEDFRWCKVASCGSGQIHDPTGGQIMKCDACKAKSCFVHDSPWHSGRSCSEYDKEIQKSPAAATNAYLDRYTKGCPKCCAKIFKNGGCDHMICRSPSCFHEFCWLCLEAYEPILKFGNHYHKKTCTYFASYTAT